jgi:hypothetical protein
MILTKRDAAVAILVEQLKCSFVERVRLAQKALERLKLRERNRSVLVCVGNAAEKINRFLKIEAEI